MYAKKRGNGQCHLRVAGQQLLFNVSLTSLTSLPESGPKSIVPRDRRGSIVNTLTVP